jgi:hypothetical protein
MLEKGIDFWVELTFSKSFKFLLLQTSSTFCGVKKWRHNIEHGDTFQNYMQQNDLDLNDIQHYSVGTITFGRVKKLAPRH